MYKISRYNYLIDYKGKKLLFNGVHGSGIVMNLNEWNHVNSLFDDLQNFEKEFPYDFDLLKNMGFIIDSEMDELAYIKYMHKVETYGKREYTLGINTTLDCNFRCWYCYETHHQGYMSFETSELVKLHLKNKIEKHEVNGINLSWFGGEPLLYFKEVVYPISKYVKSICKEHSVEFSNGITTNAYCIDEEMIDEMKEIDLHTFQITLDGNRERHNKIRNTCGQPSYDKIINNIKNLCARIPQSQITLRINYDNVTFKNGLTDVLYDFGEETRSHLKIDLHRVWQTYDSKIQEEDSYINKSALNKFVDTAKELGYMIHCHGAIFPGRFYNCYACKKDFACINYDGKVYKCTACSFSEEDCYGELKENGEIEWNMARVSKFYGFSPLENKKCMECKYLPLCLGPCPKNFMDNGYSVECYFLNEERTAEERIIDLYEESKKSH